jgi:hypothetical protein
MIVRNGLVWEIWSNRDGERRYLGFSWSARRARRRLERAQGLGTSPALRGDERRVVDPAVRSIR